MSGDYFYGNPSSHHQSGKKAHHQVEEVREFLLSTFCLEKDHELFFHSGATEGINTFFFGLGEKLHLAKKKFAMIFIKTDHSILWKIAERYQLKGWTALSLSAEENGDFPTTSIESILNDDPETLFLLNFTWVNNETGIVFPLSEIRRLRKKFSNLLVHVDATQAPGRIENFNSLSPYLDVYTFSGHKFGALKGVGFTFWDKQLSFLPFMIGGGQQKGFRSGTENVMSIYSLKLALTHLLDNFDGPKSLDYHLYFENEIKKIIGDQGKILGENASHRNLNTSTFYFPFAKSDILLAGFDLEGIEVGRGSACSTGKSQSSPILAIFFENEEETKKIIRFSLPLTWDQQSPINDKGALEQALQKIEKVLKRFLAKN